MTLAGMVSDVDGEMNGMRLDVADRFPSDNSG